MHRGHDDHHRGTGAGAGANGAGVGLVAGPGHNHAPQPRAVAQWQTPHLDHGHESDRSEHGEADLDLVESAFVEGFAVATDPTSFLRLAGVPFAATSADGTRLVLLRIEAEAVTDVGSITPHLGGESFRYDPLPAALVTRRRRLRFIYRRADGICRLSFAEVRLLIRES
jgi:hypothetical protein